MPIEFRCSQCGRLLRTPDDSAGRQARCPECGNVQAVPEPTAQVPPPPPQEPASPSPFSAPIPPNSGYDLQNPYQTPQYAAGPLPQYPASPLHAQAAARVQGPAIGLIITGALGIVGQLLNLVVTAVNPQVFRALNNPNNPNFRFQAMPPAASMAVNVLELLVGVLIIYGAIRMKNLQSYTLAMTSAILAIVPCLSPCCCIGLPIGIWALVVLLDNAVKPAFQS